MQKILLLLFIFLLALCPEGRAQHLPGVAMGNYSGINSLYHNPAFVSDNRYSVQINVVGTQFYTANNHVKYNAPYSFLGLLTNSVSDKYRNERGAVLFPRTYLKEKLNGNDKYINAGGDTRLPSIMFQLFKGKAGIGISTRARYILNMSGLSEPLARLISKTTRLEDLQGPSFGNQSGQLHFNGVGEIALTFGGVVMDNETDFVKVGVTVKRMLGLYNAHAIVKNSSFSVLPDPDPKYANLRVPMQYINANQIDVQYGMTRDEGFQNIRPTPAWLLGGAPPGSGWGFDIGAVYEYRPDINKYTYTEKGERKRDGTKNKYLYRVAVSLTDIGRVHFKNPAYLMQQNVQAQDKKFLYDTFQKMEGSEGVFNAINESLDVNGSLAPNFKSVLPMAFQASVDYNVQPNVYVSGLWVQNLISQDAFGMKAESVVAVTPRYEHKWYEISVPLTLMNRYRTPSIGLAGRVGPLWIGTDHLTGLLNIGNPRAFNLYFGLSAGLFRKAPGEQNQCWPPEDSWLRRIFSKR
ncbi:DUF5723 family protein [Dyadobacter sp. CY312]|uniref:DUF5723 family protein n=1 Tax=Dyadobacter sp. CY312 TaxID=2907303 RepID=UPI001F478059|nr:DUF5723 family protein [Dyadobacter sp. CY312]MCE7043923.1 DUF5723 family protein [Dyadobacter sp. CY312]